MVCLGVAGFGSVGNARNFLEMNLGWGGGYEKKTLPQRNSSITQKSSVNDLHLKQIFSLSFDHFCLRHLSSFLNFRIMALAIISLVECLKTHGMWAGEMAQETKALTANQVA